MLDHTQLQSDDSFPQPEEDVQSPPLSGVQIEERAMRKCIAKHERFLNGKHRHLDFTYPADKLEDAYERCGIITEDFAKTFYLGTQLMAPDKARATWAIYVWCRRTDELVDGPNADRITPEVRSAAPACLGCDSCTRVVRAESTESAGLSMLCTKLHVPHQHMLCLLRA